MTLMKLNQAENKWNFKMQILETEIDKLRTELAKCGEDGKSINKCQQTHKLMTQIKDSLKFCKPSLGLTFPGVIVISNDKSSYNIAHIAGYMTVLPILIKTCHS